MKFVLIVLALHLLGELVGNKRKNNRDNEGQEAGKIVRHPAEFDLR